MAEHKAGWIAGAVAALAVGGGALAHGAGLFADDAARVGSRLPAPHAPQIPRVPEVPRVPQAPRVPDVPAGVHIPPNSVDALNDPLVSTTIKEAIGLIRQMRKGDADERAVAKATCKVLSVAADNEPDHAFFKDMITGQVQTDNGFLTLAANRYAEKAADALTVAHHNARAGLWYVQYCLRP